MAFLIREISYPWFLARDAMGGHVAEIYVLFSIPAYTAVKLLLVTVTHFFLFTGPMKLTVAEEYV